MEQFEINAEPRSLLGKGANRRLRESGMVPGILYGARAEAQPIEVKHAELLNQVIVHGPIDGAATERRLESQF